MQAILIYGLTPSGPDIFGGVPCNPDLPLLMEQITILGSHSFWVLKCIVDVFSVIVVNFFCFSDPLHHEILDPAL